MGSWTTFERQAPDLAEVAAGLWPGIVALQRGDPTGGEVFAIAYLATVRPDGGPRLHPFCPILAGGNLYAAIARSSPKGWDLRRDPRCVVHALPGPDDAELCIRAAATEVTEDPTRDAVRDVVARAGIGGMLGSVSRDPLFELDLLQVDTAYWVDVGQPGTYAVRRQWRA